MSAVAEVSWSVASRTQHLPQFIQSAPVGFAFCDIQGRIVASNPALDKMLAILREATSSNNLFDLIVAANAPQAKSLVKKLAARHCDSFEVDSLPDAYGIRLRWAVWRAFSPDGTADRILALVTRIAASNTQWQREMGRLETIGRMATGLAHDFNNLMTGVLLYCDLLLASLEPGHRARKHAEEIRDAGIHATGLIRQLLALSKPSDGQSRLLSWNEIVEGMQRLLSRLCAERIKWQIHLDPDIGLVKIDPSQAQQVLLNLVLNARDAMPDGGSISLITQSCRIQPLKGLVREASAHQGLPCVLFAVEDNGTGMDAATRSRAFDPFFTTKGAAGTGLGLATVHQIVTNCGGLIHIDSELGQGTRVTILLPAERMEANVNINADFDTQHRFLSKAPSFTNYED